MEIVYSKHWIFKKKYRKTITDADIEYAIQHSNILKDKRWPDALNAIIYKILTAYWLD